MFARVQPTRSDPTDASEGSATRLAVATQRFYLLKRLRGHQKAAPQSGNRLVLRRGASGRSQAARYASPPRWLDDSPLRFRGHASTSRYLHCPYSKSPTPDHLLSADSSHDSGSVRTDARSASTARRTQHVARWSLTIPHACIAACTVVGPTKRKPAARRRFESAVDSGVVAVQSAVERGALRRRTAADHRSRSSGVPCSRRS